MSVTNTHQHPKMRREGKWEKKGKREKKPETFLRPFSASRSAPVNPASVAVLDVLYQILVKLLLVEAGNAI